MKDLEMVYSQRKPAAAKAGSVRHTYLQTTRLHPTSSKLETMLGLGFLRLLFSFWFCD